MKIEVRNVTKRYADQLALHDVSLEVPEQSVYGLLGPNGAARPPSSASSTKSPAPTAGRCLSTDSRCAPSTSSASGISPRNAAFTKR